MAFYETDTFSELYFKFILFKLCGGHTLNVSFYSQCCINSHLHAICFDRLWAPVRHYVILSKIFIYTLLAGRIDWAFGSLCMKARTAFPWIKWVVVRAGDRLAWKNLTGWIWIRIECIKRDFEEVATWATSRIRRVKRIGWRAARKLTRWWGSTDKIQAIPSGWITFVSL